jgi:hypothetical protein
MESIGMGRGEILEPHVSTCARKIYLFIDKIESGDFRGFQEWFKAQLEDESLGSFGTFGDLA